MSIISDTPTVMPESATLNAGQWYKMDADLVYASTGAWQVGIAPSAIASGASGTIRISGAVTVTTTSPVLSRSAMPAVEMSPWPVISTTGRLRSRALSCLRWKGLGRDPQHAQAYPDRKSVV